MPFQFHKIIGAYILFYISNPSFAQENCAHLYKASGTACIQNGEWQQALIYYRQYAEHGGIYNAFDHLALARAHLALGDTVECCARLSSAVERGSQWSGDNQYLSISHVLAGEVSNWLTKESIDYDRHHQTYVERLDQPLIQKISGMVQLDQEVRLSGRKELSEAAFKQHIHSMDSIHLEEVKQIFARFNGFPPDSLIEQRTHFELMLLIQHFIRGFPGSFDYFAGVVQQAISDFQLHPAEYAAMVDRRQYGVDRKSIYGEVPYHNEHGVAVVDNIQDVTQVDSLRFSIGLLSLKQHSIDRGFKLPTNYIEQRSPCLLQ